jgi:hypothetical protein
LRSFTRSVCTTITICRESCLSPTARARHSQRKSTDTTIQDMVGEISGGKAWTDRYAGSCSEEVEVLSQKDFRPLFMCNSGSATGPAVSNPEPSNDAQSPTRCSLNHAQSPEKTPATMAILRNLSKCHSGLDLLVSVRHKAPVFLAQLTLGQLLSDHRELRLRRPIHQNYVSSVAERP